MHRRGVELVLGGERLGVRRRADGDVGEAPRERAVASAILRASRGGRPASTRSSNESSSSVASSICSFSRSGATCSRPRRRSVSGRRPARSEGLLSKVARVGLALGGSLLALSQRLLARLELPGHFRKLARWFWGRRRRPADGAVARVIRQARRVCHE